MAFSSVRRQLDTNLALRSGLALRQGVVEAIAGAQKTHRLAESIGSVLGLQNVATGLLGGKRAPR